MGVFGRNKIEKCLLAVIMCMVVVFLLTTESLADMEPDYNIAVKLDPAAIVYLNEKIEVYCEKDGQFYMSIDLNKSNHYEYKKVFENGVYTFRARVRYDMDEEYTIIPEIQTVELTYRNNNILNEVIFTVVGVSADPELHSHLTDELEQEDFGQEEKVYTIDDIDELYEIQESIIGEAEAAFTEQEVWEQNHSFSTRHGGVNQTIPATGTETLPMHVYPELDDESVGEDENLPDSESMITSTEETIESQDEVETESNITWPTAGSILVILLIVLIVVICIGWLLSYWWRNRDE